MNEGLSVQDLKRLAMQLFDGQEEAVKAAGIMAGMWEARQLSGDLSVLALGRAGDCFEPRSPEGIRRARAARKDCGEPRTVGYGIDRPCSGGTGGCCRELR